MEVVAVPPCLGDLVPVAAITVHPDAAICCPPAPLQSALIALQVRRDNVAKSVCLGRAMARWQMEALWVQSINRLAILSGIVRNAIRRGLCTNQPECIAASVTRCCIADRHLKVTEVMGCDHMPELDHLSTRVGRSDGFFAIATTTPLCSPPSIQAVVIPRASHGLTQVAMTASTCEAG